MESASSARASFCGPRKQHWPPEPWAPTDFHVALLRQVCYLGLAGWGVPKQRWEKVAFSSHSSLFPQRHRQSLGLLLKAAVPWGSGPWVCSSFLPPTTQGETGSRTRGIPLVLPCRKWGHQFVFQGSVCHVLPPKWVCAWALSRVWLCVTPRTVARQAPLSMGFPSQEHWSRLPFPSSGDLPEPGVEPASVACPALAGGFFTKWVDLRHLSWLVKIHCEKQYVCMKPCPFPRSQEALSSVRVRDLHGSTSLKKLSTANPVPHHADSSCPNMLKPTIG